MSLMRWNDEYLTFNQVIDEQHQRLFEIINGIYDMIRVGRGNESVAYALSDLSEYTRFHFATEEKYMHETGFPGFEHHSAEHGRMLDEIRELRHRILDGSIVVTMNEMSFLKDWLLVHFTGLDRGLAAFLKERAESAIMDASKP
jgi:hemerythrin-like metal-binding protein